MLLRRISKHVNDQNWFAVAIDFAIVVFGVFIGIQVANWNAMNADQDAYESALKRLSAEIETNLAMLDRDQPSLEEGIKIIRIAQTALTTCQDDDNSKDAVGKGIRKIAGTAGLHFRRNVIEELTKTPALLARQSPAARQRFADLMFYTEFSENDARYSELAPLEWRPVTVPSIAIGTRESVEIDYLGMKFSTKSSPLTLAVPVSEACQDNELSKAFWTWEQNQTYIPVLMSKMREEYKNTLILIESELN